MESSRHDAAPAALTGRYEVERELGRGGMATVFLARELKHDRPVALKLFEPGTATALDAERFVREVQITAGLQHPHIVPLLDSGEADGRLYYVMPYVEGESLRERLLREPQLPIAEALHIACEVAGALDYAHARGVVHRDIKPGNILLTGDHAVVADFGIAWACEACAAADAAQLTLRGLPMGTPAYMSPEQAAGATDVDGRTDLYSLGCVLYEMLAGRPPFTGANITEIIQQQRSAEPAPVDRFRADVPAGVWQVLRRALAKAPDQRYASAGEFLDALRLEGGPDPSASTGGAGRARLAVAAVPHRRALAYTGVGVLIALAGFGLSSRYLIPRGTRATGAGEVAASFSGAGRSIAVLPFANLSTSKENEYFSDGITDDVLTALASVGDLRVISRTSVMQYKGTTKPLRQIAQELGVSAVLEGSVRRQGRQIRVTAQLIDARSDVHLWAHTYDRNVEDIFRIQSEIARDIAASLQARLSPQAERRMAMTPTRNLTAYDLYVQGREHFYRATPPDNAAAIALFRQALAQDSGFALARAALASAFTVQTLFTDDRKWLDSAGVAARRALLGHEDLAEAQAALGFTELHAGHLDRARDALNRAVALAPNVPLTVFALASADMRSGRLVEALWGFRKVAALEPTTAVFLGYVGSVYQALGRYDQALIWHGRAMALQPDYALRSALPLVFLARGQPDRAAAEARAWLGVARDSAHALLMVGLVDAWRGELASGRRYIERGIAGGAGFQGNAAPVLAYIALRSGEPRRAAQLIRDGRAALLRVRLASEMPGDIDWFLAELDALEGSRREAIEHLQAGYAHGFRSADLLRQDPMLASLRGDPDFVRLLGRMKADLDQMWRQVQREGG